MTSRIEVITWLNRKIPEYRESCLSGFSGHVRKQVMKDYQVLADKLLKHAHNSVGYPFKFLLRWKFDVMWSECTWVYADSSMSDHKIKVHNTASRAATELLREFDAAFKIGRCK